MEPQDLIIETPSGRVHAHAEPRGADAVVYTLGGALRGTVHITGTHHPDHWDQFTALRATFGSADAMAKVPPADSLPRLRNSTARHTGYLLAWEGPAGPQWEQSRIESTSGRPPSPKTEDTLRTVLHAVTEDATRRPDRARILDASRVRQTPALLDFFALARRNSEADIARYGSRAASDRHQARIVTAAWWTAARWLTARPHPLLTLLLADRPNSLARTAHTLALAATANEDAAAAEARRMQRFEAEAASLRSQMQPRRRTAAASPTH
ncbi:hypothetical protein AQJ46_47890 [Streptomyces canus]|uniref:Uncharacterized protein n=1 Tax=Streptomyces canus TaxID=58343 RepID=A0A101RL21_9ACTN|nr:hypothetical protein [Streptomyces canus]KUN57283.1 hypothetical protein AQJ46_47890 [Streptomyces canus]